MKHKLGLFSLITLLVTSSLCGCGKKPAPQEYKDISIIYTTDVHCGIDTNLGYSSLYAYKEQLEKNNYVTLIDSGDYLQGDFIGAISNGSYIIELMNEVGYDIITLGNHEFDYGIDELKNRLNEFNGEVTSCNFSYIGNKENKLNMINPYVIKDYGYKKIGYVGVTTPWTLIESDPKNFLEDDEVAYSFGASTTPEQFYSLVQSNIDRCKSAGADYVILLSHLGTKEEYHPYSSIDVLNHTNGVLAFLDGHAHSDIPWTTYKNKDNVDTLLVDTGYKLNEFASLTISKDGNISYEYITKYDNKSSRIDKVVEDINKRGDELGNKVVATIDVDLSINDEYGRAIRSKEMPIGNLVADAYKVVTNSDIGFVNGGGVRANLKKGDVTYKQIMDVHPFGNVLMKKKTTGQKILDYLEFTSMLTTKKRVDEQGHLIGENGAFSQVSGLRYTIDTSISTSVVTDENGNFVKVDGTRRVKNVQVLENDNYVDIDAQKEYTVSSNDFILESGGGGANMFMEDEVIPDMLVFDYEVLIEYIADILQGHLKEKYSSPEGRIIII